MKRLYHASLWSHGLFTWFYDSISTLWLTPIHNSRLLRKNTHWTFRCKQVEQCHIRGDKISTAYMLFVKQNHLLMSIKLRIIDVSYSFQHYILTNASAGNSRCLISPAQRPNEHTTCLVTWYWTNSFCWRGWELLAGQNVLQPSGNRRKISFFALGLIPHWLFVSTYGRDCIP